MEDVAANALKTNGANSKNGNPQLTALQNLRKRRLLALPSRIPQD
jgi:hypothetical protein